MCMDREQDHSAKNEAREKKLARAFLDLEDCIANLQSMSAVMRIVFQEAFREHVFRDEEGFLVAKMSDSEVNSFSYSMSHLEDLIDTLHAKYYDGLEGVTLAVKCKS